MKINPEIREQKFAMVSQWRESGLTQKQFIEQKNVSMNNFQYWLRRYRKRNEPACRQGRKRSGKFIKLPMPEKNSSPGTIFSEVIFASGSRIKFYQAIEISQLRQLVAR